MASSLLTRKRDLLYFIFFVIHVPIIFLVDTVPLLPSWLVTDFSHTLRKYYIVNYHDKFFEEAAPAWFTLFTAMELVYHAPLSVWAIGALWRGPEIYNSRFRYATANEHARPPPRPSSSPRVRRPVFRHLHRLSGRSLDLGRSHHKSEADAHVVVRTLCRSRGLHGIGHVFAAAWPDSWENQAGVIAFLEM